MIDTILLVSVVGTVVLALVFNIVALMWWVQRQWR
jgi:hypothetical protein